MARFDVHRSRDGRDVLLDCQSDFLSHLATRFMVPLLPQTWISPAIQRLNPVFEVEGRFLVMYTQLAAAAPLRELEPPVTSLSGEQDRIVAALDFLLSGF